MRRVLVIAALLAAPVVARAEPCKATLSFPTGKSAMSPQTKQTLQPMLDAMRSHPQLHARVIADGDATLAKKRGDVVKWFLVDGGIEADRIEITAGGAAGIELVGCSASLTQTVTTQLAPARPAVAEKPEPRPGGSIVDDATDFATLLAGDTTERHAAIDQGLATAHAPVVTIGNDSVGFRGEELAVRVQPAGGGLRLASATLVENTGAHQEEQIGRTYMSSDVAGGAVQGKGQKVQLDGRQLRALTRCYRKVPGLQPKDTDDIELTFGVDRAGKVIEPVVISDEDALVGCIGSVMAAWRFPALRKTKARIWLSVTLNAG